MGRTDDSRAKRIRNAKAVQATRSGLPLSKRKELAEQASTPQPITERPSTRKPLRPPRVTMDSGDGDVDAVEAHAAKNRKRNARQREIEKARTLTPEAARVAGDVSQAAEDMHMLQLCNAELRTQLTAERAKVRQLTLEVERLKAGVSEPQFPTPSTMTRRRRVSRGPK